MKNKKWIWITLTILLTLVVLVGVAGAGFRMGMMQNFNLMRNANGGPAQFPPFGQMHGFERDFNGRPGGDPHMMQGYGRGGFAHGRGGFLSPLFGLVHLAIFALLVWAGYTLFKKSGWQFVKVTAPAKSEDTPALDEKKE